MADDHDRGGEETVRGDIRRGNPDTRDTGQCACAQPPKSETGRRKPGCRIRMHAVWASLECVLQPERRAYLPPVPLEQRSLAEDLDSLFGSGSRPAPGVARRSALSRSRPAGSCAALVVATLTECPPRCSLAAVEWWVDTGYPHPLERICSERGTTMYRGGVVLTPSQKYGIVLHHLAALP